MRASKSCLISLLSCLSLSTLAQHSTMSESDLLSVPSWDAAFEHGPFLLPDLQRDIGGLHLPVTTVSKEAQTAFDHGCAWLLWGDDAEAERCFRLTITRDARCAMGYLGLALANAAHPGRAALFAGIAFELRSSASVIETRLLDGFNAFCSAPEALKNPAIVKARHQDWITDIEVVIALQDSPVLRALLARELILARDAGAEMLSRLAVDTLIPDSANHPAQALRLGLWHGQAHPGAEQALRQLPPTRRCLLHGIEWLASQGRLADALHLCEAVARVQSRADALEENARRDQALVHAQWIELLGSLAQTAKLQTIAATGDVLTMRQLQRLHEWQVLAALPELPEDLSTLINAERQHLRGVGAFESGNSKLGQECLQSLETIRTSASAARNRDEALLTKLNIWLAELRLLSAPLTVAALENAEPLQSLPAGRLADLWQRVGDMTRARRHAAEALRQQPHGLPERVDSIALEFAYGDKRTAFSHFTSDFRRHSDSTSWSRLAALNAAAEALRLPTRWTLPPQPLIELPLPAATPLPTPPSWNLESSTGDPLTPTSYAGRPAVLTFFLGAGCDHCVRQLRSLAALKPDFDQQGIALAAISTEDLAAVRAMRYQPRPGKPMQAFPFPIAADPTGQAFTAWSLRDEFASAPLHGIFILDSQGHIRWSHIGTQPLMEVAKVLGQAAAQR